MIFSEYGYTEATIRVEWSDGRFNLIVKDDKTQASATLEPEEMEELIEALDQFRISKCEPDS
jgi:hypothetical protein